MKTREEIEEKIDNLSKRNKELNHLLIFPNSNKEQYAYHIELTENTTRVLELRWVLGD